MHLINLNNIGTSFTQDIVQGLPSKPFDALYLHVPFCVKKCHYCDFYSLADRSLEHMQAYVNAVLLEATWWGPHLERSASQIDTVFFGGGTPTMLPPAMMGELLRGLRARLPFADSVEWTLEANPATIDADYCHLLHDNGVNRLSVGAQSFIASELKMLGRVHDADAVRQTIRHAGAAGIERTSIDLIYAVPGQTPETWGQSLQAAVDLGIEHLSCYCLTLEEQTPMWRLTRSGRLPEIDEQTQLQYMKQTRAVLVGHGLLPYEISNYSHIGKECRHNLHYWNCDNYLGLGPAAASHLDGLRWRNRPDLKAYLHGMLGEQKAPVTDVEELSWQQRAEEMAMMMLRTRTGIPVERFTARIAQSPSKVFGDALNRLLTLGLLKIENGSVRLTDQGVYVADEVIGELVLEVS